MENCICRVQLLFCHKRESEISTQFGKVFRLVDFHRLKQESVGEKKMLQNTKNKIREKKNYKVL